MTSWRTARRITSLPPSDVLRGYENVLPGAAERILAMVECKAAPRRLKQARDMSSVIPLGHPILVGHHSEKRDRSFRKRIRNNYDKGFEAKEKAAKLRDRAASVGQGGISSDDPDAIRKLTGKLEKIEKQQALYKAVNKALKRADKTGDETPLRELGLSEKTIAGLKEPDFAGRRGIPSYVLTNNSSNMRQILQRIEELKEAAGDRTSEERHGDVRIVDDVEENRVQIFFPGKPDTTTRQTLKSFSFRWSPTSRAWQRQRGSTALYLARRAFCPSLCTE